MGEPLHSQLLLYVIGWLVAFVPALGVAQAQPVATAPAFSWTAPEACPTQAFVVTELERLLGHPVTQGLSPDRTFAVQVQQLPDRGFRATLLVTTGTEQGERTVGHIDCEQLAKTVALVVALTIDPDAVRQRQETEPVGTGPTAPGPAPAPCQCNCPLDDGIWQKLAEISAPCSALSCPSPQPCRPCANPARPWRPPPSAAPRPAATPPFTWFVEVGVGAASGVLPELGPTVSADAGLELKERWRFELDGRYWVRQVFSPADYPTVQTSVRMLSGGARLCGLPFVADWRLVGCFGPELGDYRAASLSGIDQGSAQRGRWFALLGSLGAYFPLGSSLELGTRVDAGPVLERAAVGAMSAGGERVKLTEAKAFVANLGVTLLFKGQKSD